MNSPIVNNINSTSVAAVAPALSALGEIRCGVARVNEAQDLMVRRLDALVSRLDRRYGIPNDESPVAFDPAAHPGELPVIKDMVDYSEQKCGDIFSLISHLEGML